MSHGTSANHRDAYGLTLLHEATTREHAELARVLLRHGADVHKGDARGMTPLHTAASLGKVAFVRFLCEHGAALNARTLKGNTALIEAVSEGQIGSVTALLQLGCDVTVPSYDGKIPLMHAAESCSDVLKLLLEHHRARGSVLPLEHNGHSALYNAIRASKRENVKLLLRAGASVLFINETSWHDFHPWNWGSAQTEKLMCAFYSVAAGVNLQQFYNHKGYADMIRPYFSEPPRAAAPRALQTLCRDALRHLVLSARRVANLYDGVSCLPLPTPLREFLLYHVDINT